MRASRWSLCAAGVVVTGAVPVAAQVQTVLHGEIRPRYELRNPSGAAGGPDEFTSMRVRLGLDASLDDEVSIFAEFQDVRLWGEEAHPLFDYRADNLDLHQGYLRYQGERLGWLTATLGRMEATFGEERFVGPVDWAQQGQSFDGIRLDVERGRGNVALIAFRIGDETAAAVAADRELYGAYGTLGDTGPGSLDVYWLYDRIEGASASDSHSVGARYVFTAPGDVEGRVEGTWQTGTRGGSDVSAYMFGARAGKSLLAERASVTLWYDYLSGDDPATGDTEVFHTLFATNHRFYGLADLFLDVPAHTGGGGLQDLAVKASWRPAGRTSVAADVHSFFAAERGGLSGSHFGEEVDLTMTHRYSDHLTATAGFSHVWQDDPLAEIGRLAEDLRWFYVMLAAAF